MIEQLPSCDVDFQSRLDIGILAAPLFNIWHYDNEKLHLMFDRYFLTDMIRKRGGMNIGENSYSWYVTTTEELWRG